MGDFDYTVISANHLFKYIYPKCLQAQIQIFGIGDIINLNHYHLLLDTTMRLEREAKKVMGRKDKIILVNDIVDYPKWRPVRALNSRFPCSRKHAYQLAIGLLGRLNRESGIESGEFDYFAGILKAEYKDLFKFTLGTKGQKLKVDTMDELRKELGTKRELTKRFLFMMFIVQSQIQVSEFKNIYEYVLGRLGKVIVGDLETSEVGIHYNRLGKTLLISNSYIKDDGLYHCKLGGKPKLTSIYKVKNPIEVKTPKILSISPRLSLGYYSMVVDLDIGNFKVMGKMLGKVRKAKEYVRSLDFETDAEVITRELYEKSGLFKQYRLITT